jgi:AcrR family transcriptional regulator
VPESETGRGPGRAPRAATGRRRAPATRSRTPLSRDQIVAGALDFLRTHPLGELSMRRLAAELGTAATSLYWHVADKEELLDLVLEGVFAEVRLPEPGPPAAWAEDVGAALTELRRVLREHRAVAPLLVGRAHFGPQTLRAVEFVLAALDRSGLPADLVPLAYDLLANYTIGGVLVEASWYGARGTEPPAPDGSGAPLDDGGAGEFLAALPAADFPVLSALGNRLFGHDDDTAFQYGLRRLLAGIATDLDAS